MHSSYGRYATIPWATLVDNIYSLYCFYVNVYMHVYA